MFNLGIIKNYLLHRLSANNRHGLHSPFVYKLVDEVIYGFSAKITVTETGKDFRQTKADRLIYRLVAYWQPRNIAIYGKVAVPVSNYLKAAAPNTEIYTDEGNNCATGAGEKLDIAVIGANIASQTLKYFDCCMTFAHDNTMLIVAGIYNNSEMKQAWQHIKSRPEVTVTIDLFWIGLVFFRKGQAKEDFKVRV